MNKKRSGGFAVILGLLIVVMISIYFMAQQYQKLAERNHNVIDKETYVEGQRTSTESPLDRAYGARESLEAHDRALLQ